MAVTCNECGARNPGEQDFCARCGAVLPTVPGIAGEFVLPEWLTRAAAESATASPVVVRRRTSREETMPASPAFASVPSGGLSSAMPDWLKGPVQEKESEESFLTDPTDTTSFISEEDLPSWIRQIAEADAKRRADAERIADSDATNETETDVTPPVQVKRRLLPGEMEAVRESTVPSVGRSDIATAEPAERRPIAPAPVTAPAGSPTATRNAPESGRATPARMPRTLSSFSSRGLRYALVSAVVVLLLIILFVAVR